MRIDLERKSSLTNYEYTALLDGTPLSRIKAKRKIWPLRHEAVLEKLDGERLASSRQTSVLPRILEKVPYWFGCPFAFRLGTSDIGWFRDWPNLKQAEARGMINGIEHRIYGQRGTVCSLYRWPDQIGLIDREAKSECDGGKYHAEFDDDLDAVFCTCCILFVDLAWHSNNALTFTSTSYEWNTQIGGVSQNPAWRPKSTKSGSRDQEKDSVV